MFTMPWALATEWRSSVNFNRFALPIFLLIFGSATHAQTVEESPRNPRIAFSGLHGGVFERLKDFAGSVGMDVDFVNDEQIGEESIDLGQFDLFVLQHIRDEYKAQYGRLIESARERNLSFRVLSLSGLAESNLPELAKSGIIESDPVVATYYGNTPENLRRMLIYLGVTYLGMEGGIIAPEPLIVSGLYHPDHTDLFADVAQWKAWCIQSGRDIESVPLVCITVHATHLTFQQPLVVAALVREFERQGAAAIAIIDFGEYYESQMRELQPDLVVHTCHSRDTVSQREKWGVPHTHSIFFRQQSIDDWQISIEGLASSEMTFQIVGQELIGAIEPQIGSGTIHGGGSEEAFKPIPDRIEHLASRSLAWIKLAKTPNDKKRIAFVYYDREMGKAELMRGSATGMFMNAPRSMVNILQEMRDRGYKPNRVPDNEDQLLAWMTEYGRQIGVWAPGVLDRLAHSGQAILVPTGVYQTWFEKHVPPELQADVIAKWGEAPGNFLVWENAGESYIVIPRIDLGNITLLPQPLRGEAHDTSLVHDIRVPPPHNYLATYFWLAEEFKADAMIHFGTHGSEFLLPGKPTGLSGHDWPDIVMGNIPNINPWVINNLGESSPVKRRAYAVLIDHLVPPSVNAELSDELANLHGDIDKWIVLDDGLLKEKFRQSVTRQVRENGLLVDCHLKLADDELLSKQQIETVLAYLHDIHNDTTPVSLHVFGEPPRDDLLVPYLVTCLGSDFVDRLSRVIEVPPGEALTDGDREKYLRSKAEEIIALVVEQEFSSDEALASVGASDSVDDELQKSFKLLSNLVDGFRQTPNELNQLMAALDGKFIAPGPGNSPDRNPAVLPTGRNMVVMNPEEVPTRPSWEVGKQLVDDLLASRLQQNRRYPNKIAFTLNSFATFQDFGVMESQILYLMGVRPLWNEKNLVADVELIPLDELDRPRIDVFIAGLSYYRDMLPTRMRLLDRAIRLVADAEESDEENFVRRGSQLAEAELIEKGHSPELAKIQSTARIFGYPLGQQGSAGYYYLVEKSGEWDSQEQLMDAYLSHVRNVYTEGAWGTPAADAYDQQIAGTEIVLRSWSDRTRSPLSNKYDWYIGGSLAAAVKHITGEEPEFLLSDVRDPKKASLVSAEDALRKDFRVRLFNRKWIEGMMREGYAGADQVAVHVSNTMGWKIMRPDSVGDDLWEEIVDIYIRDKKNLNIREWFEAENPFAYQEMNEILLETIRKDYWEPDQATIREIAQEYARSVARHGEGGGLRGGGNEKLESFVQAILGEIEGEEADQLLASYNVRAAEQTGVVAALPTNRTALAAVSESPEPTALAAGRESPTQTNEAAAANTEPEEVVGKTLEPVTQPSSPANETPWRVLIFASLAAFFLGGFWLRWGTPRR